MPQQQIEPYWQMAQQYVLADNTFASNLDCSFVAHQYIVAAYASGAVDAPYSLWGCQGGPTDLVHTLTAERSRGTPIVVCFKNPTIASEADAENVSWRFYAGQIYGDGGLWSSYQADKAIYEGPDWNADVINPPSQFLTDVAAGKLAAIMWITPIFVTSDHPGANASQGPAWVASIVDALGTSKFWDSTAIFVFWDDWGGMFDPVQPPYEDYDGSGFRVPLHHGVTVCKAELCLARAVRNGERAALHGGQLRPRALGEGRLARERSCRRRLRLHAKAAQVQEDRGEQTGVVLDAARARQRAAALAAHHRR